jgi:hypothetical protein
MNRRAFLRILPGSLIAPLAAEAQQPEKILDGHLLRRLEAPAVVP